MTEEDKDLIIESLCDRLRLMLASENQELIKFREEANAAGKDNDFFKDRIARMAKENEELKDGIIRAQNDRDQTIAANARLLLEKEGLEEKCKEEKTCRHNALELIREQAMEMEELKRKLISLGKDYADRNDRMHKAEEEARHLTATHHQDRLLIKETCEELKKKESQLSCLEHNYERDMEGKDNKIKNMEERNAYLCSRVDELVAEKRALDGLLAKLQEQAEKLEKEAKQPAYGLKEWQELLERLPKPPQIPPIVPQISPRFTREWDEGEVVLTGQLIGQNGTVK